MVAIKSIGRVLKERRTELGFGLSEAETFTKIQKLYIVALETDDYKALPGEFYVRAYLKQYAEKLGLNADNILQAYDEGHGITVADDPMEDYHFVKPSNRFEPEEEEIGPRTWRYYVPIITLSGVALVIVGAVTAAVLLNRPNSPNLINTDYTYSQSVSQTSQTTQVTTKSTIQSSSSVAQPTEKLTVTGANSSLTATLDNATTPVKVTFTAGTGAAAWVLVRNSDMNTAGVTINAQNPTVTATLTATSTSSTITLGNHDNITMAINGQSVDLSKFANTGGPYNIQLTVNPLQPQTPANTTTVTNASN